MTAKSAGVLRRQRGAQVGGGGAPAEVESIAWAARELGISETYAYRLAHSGELPGAFAVGTRWRVSVPRFRAAVHGDELPEPIVEHPIAQ
jgi:excisionase family DNA binding protein